MTLEGSGRPCPDRASDTGRRRRGAFRHWRESRRPQSWRPGGGERTRWPRWIHGCESIALARRRHLILETSCWTHSLGDRIQGETTYRPPRTTACRRTGDRSVRSTTRVGHVRVRESEKRCGTPASESGRRRHAGSPRSTATRNSERIANPVAPRHRRLTESIDALPPLWIVRRRSVLSVLSERRSQPVQQV